MSVNLNPQAEQMADESMVRNLAAQIDCIWPQERPLFERYGLGGGIRILDAGCGTGEAAGRLAALYDRAEVLGIDIIEPHLELARGHLERFGARVRFENRSIFEMGLPEKSFDLTVCRHVLQAIPHADRAIAELVRVTKPGGRIHLIAEDYGMIHIAERALNPDDFWTVVPGEFGRALGTDLHIGRHAPAILRGLGLRDVRTDYVIVDAQHAPRESFAQIWIAWRDGYCEAIGEHTSFSAERARAQFDDQIATIRDEKSYAVWFVPVVTGVVPG